MGLPKQKISIYKKTEEWKKDTINYYEKLSYSSVSSNRTTNYIKKINYDLANGKFDKKDLEYVCNPLGLSEGSNEFPATLQHYDIISPALNLLIGEETKRKDNCIVVSQSLTDINRKQKALKDKINNLLQQKLLSEMDPTTIDPNQPLPTPEEIIKYEKHNITDLLESKANKLLKYIKRDLNTKEIFKRGWKDALIAGEEIYWAGVSNNSLLLRRCNPLNITVVLDGDTDYIDDAIAVVEVRMLSPSSIIDEFGEDLKPNELTKLEEISKRFTSGYGMVSSNPTFSIDKSLNVVDTGTSNFSTFSTSAGSFNSELIRVVRIEWKSYKKLYYLTYEDELGIPVEQIVDEFIDKKLLRETYPNIKIEEFWVNEAWEGIKIGDDIFVNVRPKQNQRRKLDNPYVCKLGYTGLIYDATNSKSVSLIDRMKPYQYLYNIICYRLELTFARDDGKKFVMDISSVPRSEGIDVDRWMYYFKALNIAFVNSFEEQRKGSHIGKTPTFNQFQAIDLSLANVIQNYISTLDYIKQQVAFISGVSPQRLGAIENRELVGNVERSVQQSALITEYRFDAHDEVKRRVYTALLECAKIAYKDGKKIQYILDDMGVEILELSEFEFENSEFGVFVSNASEDLAFVETLKQLSQAALNSDKADLSTIMDTLINNSPSDIIKTLKRSEEAKYQREQAAVQEQLASQEKIKQMELEHIQAERDLKLYEIDSNNETKIMVAEINAMRSIEGPTDMDNDGIPDPIEVANLSLKERELASKAYSERQKVEFDNKKHEQELKLKDKELALKREIEEKKIKAIEVQNNSQELMQDKANKLKEKELLMKERIEKLKLQAAKTKAKNKPKSK